MMNQLHPAWWLIAAGGALALAGGLWLLAGHVPWLGHLPGDIRFEGPRVRIYLPLATCLIISLVLTIVLNLLIRLWEK